MVTNSLIKHLSRREVDAIMAHEIGHLQAKHPQKSGTITLGVIVIVNLIGMNYIYEMQLENMAPVVFAVALAMSSLILLFVSRRNERQADAIGSWA